MAENIRQFVMQNNALRLELDFDRQDVIRSFTNRGSEALCNCGRPLFFLRIYNSLYSNADFLLQSVSVCEDRTEQLLTAHYTREEDCLAVKIHFINDRRETIRVLYQVYDGYRYGVPYVSFLRIPLLSELELDGEGDTLMAPGCQFRSEQGKKIIMPLRDYQYSSDIRPPLVLLGKDRRHGFSVTFPVFSDLGSPGPNQNQNKILTERESAQSIREDEIFIAPDASFNDTVELMITGLCRGWAEAFDRYRDFWSAKYDFSEYKREDLQWFYNTAIHNFVFFYGGEGFDRRTMKIDVDGLLRQGEEFGGYDTVTIWNQYPRLGIDQRTQWDFYDDFPGGRAALREAVDQFHKRGVYVLLPYIPWDQGRTETTESMGDEFARLVADTDADGYQLDTMCDLPYSFRKKCDNVKPGVLLQTQFHPTKNHPIEFLTSSWDEFWRREPMPEVDVLRFLLPQHIAPQIGRWLRYEDKNMLIQRAIFGGAPLVIWQDIFGRWLPYSDDQKATIRAWKKLYLGYRDIFQGPKPIPLYDTACEGVYCNVFADAAERRSIYALYNENTEAAEAELELWLPGAAHAEAIFGDARPELCGKSLRVHAPARSVVQVLVENA